MKWTIIQAGNHKSDSKPALWVRRGDKGWYWLKGTQVTRHGPFKTATQAKQAAQGAVFPLPPEMTTNEEE